MWYHQALSGGEGSSWFLVASKHKLGRGAWRNSPYWGNRGDPGTLVGCRGGKFPSTSYYSVRGLAHAARNQLSLFNGPSGAILYGVPIPRRLGVELGANLRRRLVAPSLVLLFRLYRLSSVVTLLHSTGPLIDSTRAHWKRPRSLPLRPSLHLLVDMWRTPCM